MLNEKARSKSQRRLMGQAYAVRKYLDSNGEEGLDPQKINKYYRKEILKIAKNINKKELRKFAKTPEKNLPEQVKKVKEEFDSSAMSSLDTIEGMGNVHPPTYDSNGSGDQFISLNGNVTKDKKKKRKKQIFSPIIDFDTFIKISKINQ